MLCEFVASNSTDKDTVAIASVLQVLNELGIRLYAELPE